MLLLILQFLLYLHRFHCIQAFLLCLLKISQLSLWKNSGIYIEQKGHKESQFKQDSIKSDTKENTKTLIIDTKSFYVKEVMLYSFIFIFLKWILTYLIWWYKWRMGSKLYIVLMLATLWNCVNTINRL